MQSIKSHFLKSLRENGHSITPQRELVIEQILANASHFDIEELFQEIRRKKIPVSRATAYRTIAHLEKANLVRKYGFGEAHGHYEVAVGEKHHEHLVCTECGKIIEFANAGFERQIRQIAKSHDFTMHSHSVGIFGQCKDCVKRKILSGKTNA
jgi:Fur family ferric uptake transcriptional regulator